MKDSLAKWYEPVDVTYLKRWYRVSACFILLFIGVDILRDDSMGIVITTLAFLCILLFLAMEPRSHSMKHRHIALLCGLALSVIGVIRFSGYSLTIFNMWMNSFFIALGCFTLYCFTNLPVRAWTSKEISSSGLERGFERNTNLVSRFRAFETHFLLIHFTFLSLLPIVWILDISLSPGNALGGKFGDEFSLEHFEKILTSDSFWIWMKNSLIVSVGTTLVGLLIAIPAGYAFSRFKFTGRSTSMFAFLLVQMFPGIIILVPYFLVMKTLGLLDSHLGLILAYSVTALPLCVWMLKGFFDTIPRELEEAAILDGCNQFEVFTRIILPLSMPAIAVTALFSFLAAWNEFLLALTFNSSNDMFTLPVGLASLISSTSQAWGDFAAASLLVSLPVALLFIVFQKFLIEGLSAGGVKG